jgi:hypothetical protein
MSVGLSRRADLTDQNADPKRRGLARDRAKFHAIGMTSVGAHPPILDADPQHDHRSGQIVKAVAVASWNSRKRATEEERNEFITWSFGGGPEVCVDAGSG